jgi:hypothetical protein
MKVKIGSQVGNWLIVSERYKNKNIYWNDCECICGEKRAVRNYWLNNSLSKGCGCTNVKERFKSKCVGDLSASYYTSFKSSRVIKGIFFDNEITMEFLWDLFLKQNKKCAISGIDIVLNTRWSEQNKGKFTEIIQTASLDRIDNSKGYTKNNVQWVHKDINFMRGGLAVNDFVFFCKKVAENYFNITVDNVDYSGKRKYFNNQSMKELRKTNKRYKQK